jgi:hypothetical protein
VAAAIGTDGTIYAIGGTDATGVASAEVDAYDPETKTWSTIIGLPTPRTGLAAATAKDGTIYAIGGEAFNGTNGYTSYEVDAFNPISKTWSTVPSLPAARQALAAATGPDGTIYALGGQTVPVLGRLTMTQGRVPDPTNYSNEVDAYDPFTSTWRVMPSLPTARLDLGAAVGTDGTIYALAGNMFKSANTKSDTSNEVDSYLPQGSLILSLTQQEMVTARPVITSAAIASFIAGSSGTFTVESTGFPTTVLSETGALPGGVTFTDNHNGKATLAGTAAFDTGGVHTLTITASNSAGVATLTFSLTVALPALPPPSTLGQVAATLTHGLEHYQDFVTNAYKSYLGRTPAPVEVNGWAALMQKGLSDEQVEADFLSSAEYIADHHGTGAAWVRALYQDLLGRTPSQAEVDAWMNVLNQGRTPAQVAYGFATSPEREGDRVAGDYLTFLGRAASHAEFAGAVFAFAHGLTNENLVADLLSSAEYYNNPNKGKGDNRDWIESATQDELQRAPTAVEINGQEAALMPTNLVRVPSRSRTAYSSTSSS